MCLISAELLAPPTARPKVPLSALSHCGRVASDTTARLAIDVRNAPESTAGASRISVELVDKFSPGELAEVDEIAENLRELVPIYGVAFEPQIQATAARIWRWRRVYAYLNEHGEDASGSLLKNLDVLERTLQRDFDVFGLNPRSATELGIDLARLQSARTEDEGRIDLDRLKSEERATFANLLEKARTNDDAG